MYDDRFLVLLERPPVVHICPNNKISMMCWSDCIEDTQNPFEWSVIKAYISNGLWFFNPFVHLDHDITGKNIKYLEMTIVGIGNKSDDSMPLLTVLCFFYHSYWFNFYYIGKQIKQSQPHWLVWKIQNLFVQEKAKATGFLLFQWPWRKRQDFSSCCSQLVYWKKELSESVNIVVCPGWFCLVMKKVKQFYLPFASHSFDISEIHN